METSLFDDLTRTLVGKPTRRGVLRLLAGSALGGIVPTRLLPPTARSASKGKGKEKGKKNKGKKDKPKPRTCAANYQGCLSRPCCSKNCCAGTCIPSDELCCIDPAGGATNCGSGTVCCDPVNSTSFGCASPGQPVCCAWGIELYYPAGTTCCHAAEDGNDGACKDPEFPHCCPAAKGAGCCSNDRPVCCSDNSDSHYCCPGDTVCCPGEGEGGCCVLH